MDKNGIKLKLRHYFHDEKAPQISDNMFIPKQKPMKEVLSQKLESEFQGRSYDMLIGHATLVCVRHIFLELERRKTLDVRTCGELFYHCCDELPDLKIREAVLLIFKAMEAFLLKFSQGGQEVLKACLEYFIKALPTHILALMPISGCGS